MAIEKCKTCGHDRIVPDPEVKPDVDITDEGHKDAIESKKELCFRVLYAIETGTPIGKPNLVVRYYDGKNGSRQITYGKAQTTEQGNLDELIRMYVSNPEAKAEYTNSFKNYLPKIGKISLVKDNKFLDLLRSAGQFDPVMSKVQDEFFEKVYWNKAKAWWEKYQFELPLSALVVFDSFIHSGSVPTWLRKRFTASPHNEKLWVTQYVDTRHRWLATWGDGVSSKSKLLRTSSYRTKFLKEEIARGNWYLDNLPLKPNGILVS